MSSAQLATRLKEARELADLSLREAGRVIGVSNVQILFYESEQVALDDSQYHKFIKAYERAARQKLRIQSRKVSKLSKLSS